MFEYKSMLYVRSISKPCPCCKAPNVHARGHACHHMNCKVKGCGWGNSVGYCYICGGKWTGSYNGCPTRNCPCRAHNDIYCPPLSAIGTGAECGCQLCHECQTGGKPCDTCPGASQCPVCNKEVWYDETAEKWYFFREGQKTMDEVIIPKVRGPNSKNYPEAGWWDIQKPADLED